VKDGHATRRRPRSRIARLRRLARYKFLIPVYRSPHPPEYTARGVAIGVFWGVTPFMGLQTILMIGTWQVLRRAFHKDASLLQALIWAWVNNPITMIPMYYVFYLSGLWLTQTPGSIGGYDAFVALWDQGQHEATFLARAVLIAERIGVALTVGSLPFAFLGSWIGYRWALHVTRARRRRLARVESLPGAQRV
jgi:uncharacterized protein (DUF2062 family)